MDFTLKTPQDLQKELAEKIKDLRLLRNWKRSTLAKKSGVNEYTLRRFEQTGKTSLENFLKLMHALGRLDETNALLKMPAARSLKELRDNETITTPKKRGRI